MKTSFPCRLVVDLPNWVGDLVMALPATHRLIEANSAGDTTIHTLSSLDRLCKTVFPTIRVVASPRKADPIGSALRVCRNGGRFDLGVTFRHAWRAKILLKMAARYTLASTGGGACLVIDRRYAVDRGRHQVFDAVPILLALGVEDFDPSRLVELSDHLIEEGRIELVNAGLLGCRVVGLAPGGAWGRSKRWPLESFGRLAARLRETGASPLLLVGPGEEDLAEGVRTASGIEIPIAGLGLDVAGLAGIIGHLTVLVGNDSGPAHIAAMIGVPSLTIFGPTDPARTAPLGRRNSVVCLELECAPCREPRCPLGHGACMTDLGVDEVFEAVKGVMGGGIRSLQSVIRNSGNR